MSQVSMYFDWLCREQVNQLVNVCFRVRGHNGLPYSAIVSMSPDTAEALVKKVADLGDNCEAVWATVHRIRPDTGNVKRVSKEDVSDYRYLAIDVDAKVSHSLNVSATDDERAKTQATAEQVTTYLQSFGLPLPLKVMSGNGSLLLFPIDLPYTDDTYSLLERLGKVLASKFDDKHCNIDEAVIKDPSRILGVVGTVNRKMEVPLENRYAKMREVIGDYPPNVPMAADAFILAVNGILRENNAPSMFDEVATPTMAATAPTATTATVISHKKSDAPIIGWEAVEAVDTVGDKLSRCKAYIDKCPDAVEGNGGSNATMRAACECFRFGLSDSQANELMQWFNTTKCRPQWDDKSLRHKLDDAYKTVSAKGEVGSRLSTPTVATVASTVEADEDEPRTVEPYPMTDVGNAEHFRDAHGDNLRYVHLWNAWMVWDGKRWARDNTLKVRKLALKHVRKAMPLYATTIKDDERRTKYLKWASQSQSENKIDAMVSLASTLLACEPTVFDAKPNLFNCFNGTIELDTQSFRPHHREDMLIKMSNVEYDATAVCPLWDKFIHRIFQDAEGKPRDEVIEYVKRAVGYSMTADVSAQSLFVLHGKGKNGKTTFVKAVKRVMGEYSQSGMQSLLLKLGGNNGSRNTDDEADLFGSRMVAVSETDEGMRFDASKVKRLVDTDTIKAMRKFEHPFEFVATHKLWLCCNHMPRVDGNDDAMKRRLKKVPFLVQIPSDERDEHLGDKLETEASGILNWMLQGLRAWYADGRKLNEPREIQDAVGEYFHENDTFGSFLSERIQPNDAERAAVANVYRVYCGWADENGLSFKLTKIEFGKRMKERGYENKPSHGIRYFKGCSLRSVDAVDDYATVDAVDDRPF